MPRPNVAGNNNLIGVAGVGNFTLTGTGNQTGTRAAPLDAGLGPLANNGGPTMTRALLTGSPAIDAGDPAQWPASGVFHNSTSAEFRVHESSMVTAQARQGLILAHSSYTCCRLSRQSCWAITLERCGGRG